MTRALWLKLALIIASAAAAWWILRACGLDPLHLTPERIRLFIASFGVWAPAVYLVLFGQPVVPLPASIMIIAAGLVFGPWWGTAAAMAGEMLRAATQYALARRLGHKLISRFLRGRMLAINHLITRHAFRSVLAMRLISGFPYDVQNFSLGCSDVPFIPYLSATALGIFPCTVAFVYFGNALSTPRALAIGLALLLVIVGITWVQSGKLVTPSAGPSDPPATH